jgi:excisionase family DNA binding protein
MEGVGTGRNYLSDAAQDDFLSVQECAKLLKMSTRFVYDKLRAGEGPPHKRFGNRYRIYRAHFLKWAKPKGK